MESFPSLGASKQSLDGHLGECAALGGYLPLRETRRARKSLPTPAGMGLQLVQACGLYWTLNELSEALKGFPLAVEQGLHTRRCLFIGQGGSWETRI